MPFAGASKGFNLLIIEFPSDKTQLGSGILYGFVELIVTGAALCMYFPIIELYLFVFFSCGFLFGPK